MRIIIIIILKEYIYCCADPNHTGENKGELIDFHKKKKICKKLGIKGLLYHPKPTT